MSCSGTLSFITVHLIWCVIIIYINGTKLKFCRDSHEIAGLRANIAQWAVFAEVEAGTRFFASGSRGVSGTQTINNDFQLSDFVSGVRI